MIPVAGSAYTYAYATLGELLAWIIGWDLILEYLFCAPTVAVGWSGHFVAFLKEFGIVLPEHLTSSPDALARFEREAKAVAALSHPNILAIHWMRAVQIAKKSAAKAATKGALQSNATAMPPGKLPTWSRFMPEPSSCCVIWVLCARKATADVTIEVRKIHR